MRKISDPPFLKQGQVGGLKSGHQSMIVRMVSPTGSISTISLREKRCFIRYINAIMERVSLNDPHEWKMIGLENIESDEMYDRLKDGLVFLHLIDQILPNLVEWKIVYKSKSGEELNKIKRVQNHHHALQCCKGLGIVIVNISADDCAEGKPMALHSILSILIREELSKSLNILFNFHVLALKKHEEESMSEFMSQSDQTLLLRWINTHHLETKFNTRVSGLGEEWKDGKMFEMLLQSVLGKRYCNEDTTHQSGEDRIAHVLQCIEENGLNKKRILLEVEDIKCGEKSLISALLMSVFSSCEESAKSILIPHTREELERLAAEATDISLSTLVSVLPSSFFSSSNNRDAGWDWNNGSVSGDMLTMGQSFLTFLKHISLTMQSGINDIIKQRERNAEREKPMTTRSTVEMVNTNHETNKKSVNGNNDRVNPESLQSQAVVTHVTSKNAEIESNQPSIKVENDQVHTDRHQLEPTNGDETEYERKDLHAVKEENKVLLNKLHSLTSCVQTASQDITYLLSTKKDVLNTFAEYKLGGNLAVDKVLSNKGVIRSAFCEKRGTSRKSWKKRYFILFKDFLLYYKSKDGSEKPKGIQYLDVSTTAELIDSEERKGKLFVIKSANRALYCCAESDEERFAWIQSINNLLRHDL
ncbi:hypothetical protein C9374_004753 [Naegleria lovaniensis]|uniref:Uncharacterized protein n=1 Tax=Naegleria lovaniensis TaxID=51637 RepID=A0AA88GKR6_NAELO|nr:uncharacterized protein C9374_004753 [Naegleria lovaniensis]KAG2382786.1 hypothetical protein C9374_004753 [Naegleria lovaniensis]